MPDMLNGVEVGVKDIQREEQPVKAPMQEMMHQENLGPASSQK